MSWIAKILGDTTGTVIGQVADVADRFHLSGEEKQRFKLEMEALLQKRDAEIEATLRTSLQAKERVLVAELSQDDKFTKRARPGVIWAGLGFILWNYCIVPSVFAFAGRSIEPFKLPVEFWVAWGGICTTWVIGRTAEKKMGTTKATKMITGSDDLPSLLD